ncbi:unnamed protein product [Adineta ricciae]|uniref:FAD-binding domain-containing protein n=1 Tax=Adineta ricciae TaxID=249248 RepID=A0A814MWD3_ADIRI|nr:unnamed protein product [Adineta ricciae]CAF1396089.1 unnamed protein product [Adineta ricciae]
MNPVDNDDIIDITIIGGGISGLITALYLSRLNVRLRLFEQSEHIDTVGFGLNLQPYCVKCLYELGLENQLNQVGIQTKKALFYSRHGQFIFEDLRGLDGGYSHPMYSVHRGYLHQILFYQLQKLTSPSTIQLSHKLIEFNEKSNLIELKFLNTKINKIKVIQTKILIGADGINSSVRKIFYPNEGLPVWKGLQIWRGITYQENTYLDGKTMICMGNPDTKYFILYPLSNNLINWACVLRIQNETNSSSLSLNSIDWTNKGNHQDFLPLIQEMKLDFIDIEQLIKSSMNINQFPITDRDQIPRWTFNCVTLIGDAAHPMYPNGGNGASQAILDAQQLYRSFILHGITNKALEHYESIRHPLTDRMVLLARQYGPDEILRIIDHRSPNPFQHLSQIISSEEIQSIYENYKKKVSIEK